MDINLSNITQYTYEDVLLKHGSFNNSVSYIPFEDCVQYTEALRSHVVGLQLTLLAMIIFTLIILYFNVLKKKKKENSV